MKALTDSEGIIFKGGVTHDNLLRSMFKNNLTL